MDEQSASIALAQFVQKYGEEALKELVQDVQQANTIILAVRLKE